MTSDSRSGRPRRRRELDAPFRDRRARRSSAPAHASPIGSERNRCRAPLPVGEMLGDDERGRRCPLIRTPPRCRADPGGAEEGEDDLPVWRAWPRGTLARALPVLAASQAGDGSGRSRPSTRSSTSSRAAAGRCRVDLQQVEGWYLDAYGGRSLGGLARRYGQLREAPPGRSSREGGRRTALPAGS